MTEAPGAAITGTAAVREPKIGTGVVVTPFVVVPGAATVDVVGLTVVEVSFPAVVAPSAVVWAPPCAAVDFPRIVTGATVVLSLGAVEAG